MSKKNAPNKRATTDYARNSIEIKQALMDNRAPRFVGSWQDRVHAIAVCSKALGTEALEFVMMSLIEGIAQEADNYRAGCLELEARLEAATGKGSLEKTTESIAALGKALRSAGININSLRSSDQEKLLMRLCDESE